MYRHPRPIVTRIRLTEAQNATLVALAEEDGGRTVGEMASVVLGAALEAYVAVRPSGHRQFIAWLRSLSRADVREARTQSRKELEALRALLASVEHQASKFEAALREEDLAGRGERTNRLLS